MKRVFFLVPVLIVSAVSVPAAPNPSFAVWGMHSGMSKSEVTSSLRQTPHGSFSLVSCTERDKFQEYTCTYTDHQTSGVEVSFSPKDRVWAFKVELRYDNPDKVSDAWDYWRSSMTKTLGAPTAKQDNLPYHYEWVYKDARDEERERILCDVTFVKFLDEFILTVTCMDWEVEAAKGTIP